MAAADSLSRAISEPVLVLPFFCRRGRKIRHWAWMVLGGGRVYLPWRPASSGWLHAPSPAGCREPFFSSLSSVLTTARSGPQKILAAAFIQGVSNRAALPGDRGGGEEFRKSEGLGMASSAQAYWLLRVPPRRSGAAGGCASAHSEAASRGGKQSGRARDPSVATAGSQP